jgi:hypothetical protein
MGGGGDPAGGGGDSTGGGGDSAGGGGDLAGQLHCTITFFFFADTHRHMAIDRWQHAHLVVFTVSV